MTSKPRRENALFDRLKRARLLRAVVLTLALPLAACAGDGEEKASFGEVGYIEGFFGGLSVDEPNAALVGRDVLTAGGTAADAAVAMGFALSVTYPSGITLGGGGSCVVHDATLGVTEALDFIARPGSGPAGDRPTAVPAMTRGMVALHARYGRLDWRRLVAPAEQLARLGHRASRAFATELAPAAGALFADPDLREIFLRPDGRPVGEGDRFTQLDLGGLLARIRTQGGGVLYTGAFADRLVEAYRAAGGSLTREDLRSFIPEWRSTLLIPFGTGELHVAPPPAQAGPVMAQSFALLAADDRYADASDGERPHLLAEVSKRALADRRRWLGADLFAAPDAASLIAEARLARLFAGYSPIDASVQAPDGPPRDLVEAPAGAGFVVVDREGMAVACELTNYYPFGTGRVVEGTGIIPAAAPTGRGRNPLSLGPAVAVDATSLAFEFAVASVGGAFAQATSTQLSADVLLRGLGPREAIALPRVLGVDAPNLTVLESNAPDGSQEAAMAEALRISGHEVQRTDWPARANLVHCPFGLPNPNRGSFCAVANDPRGFGLAVTAADES
ncbi:MAG: gamma-glutamyltransferase [Marivibrio sp.]|uniref:gamma-glutamyltransferase n=1 Tax=Marivibrio sp. TaxID=2039719 RepID=UPI0032F06BFD